MATLRIVKGDDKGRVFTIPAVGATLGRDGRSSDIVLKHEGVSRRHARVYGDEHGDYYVQDLESRNKTFVNDKDLAELPRLTCRLKHKDRIRICNFVLVFHADGSSDTSFVEVVEDSQPTPKITSTIDLHDSDSDDEELQKTAMVRLKALLQISDDLANMIELKDVLP
jgi:pSer/pThr/pTyr-binding forkhead associated (FHA) protein